MRCEFSGIKCCCAVRYMGITIVMGGDGTQCVIVVEVVNGWYSTIKCWLMLFYSSVLLVYFISYISAICNTFYIWYQVYARSP